MLLLTHCSFVGAQTNNSSAIQDKRLSDITLLCAHNATSNYSKGSNVVANQSLTLNELLQAGVRAFKVPIHVGIFWNIDIGSFDIGPLFHLPTISIKYHEQAVLAHALAPSEAIHQEKLIYGAIADSTVIQALQNLPGFGQLFKKTFQEILAQSIDKGVILSKLSWMIDRSSLSLEEFLITLRIFLENHPQEFLVITPNVNIKEIKDFYYIIQAFEASDMVKYLYIHEPGKPWPTIAELINKNKRFLCFIQHANEYDTDIIKHYGSSHLISKIATMSKLSFNTQYAYHAIEDFASKDCCIFGTSCTATNGTPPIMILQHFITKGLAGDQNIAQEANKPNIIWQHIKNCSTATGLLPNFIMLDFLTQESIQQINQEIIMPLNTRRAYYQNTLIPQSGATAPCTHCTN